jgi:hypothetical protein
MHIFEADLTDLRLNTSVKRIIESVCADIDDSTDEKVVAASTVLDWWQKLVQSGYKGFKEDMRGHHKRDLWLARLLGRFGRLGIGSNVMAKQRALDSTEPWRASLPKVVKQQDKFTLRSKFKSETGNLNIVQESQLKKIWKLNADVTRAQFKEEVVKAAPRGKERFLRNLARLTTCRLYNNAYTTRRCRGGMQRLLSGRTRMDHEKMRRDAIFPAPK